MRTVAARVALAALLALAAGCATRADLLQQDRQLRGQIQEQRRQLQQMQKELERLRADVEESSGGHGRGAAASDERIAALEQRIQQLEGDGAPPPPAAETPPPGPPVTPPPPTPHETPPPAAVAAEDDAWRKEVAKEQAAAGALSVPERADYLAILDGLARKECAHAVPQLNSFVGKYKDSPLADNALYWVARCHAAGHDQNAAISKFYEVVTRYPKGDKVAAALFAQGNLFIDMGNTPDARIVLGKLIRDYPASEEAARARQRLAELPN